MLRGIPHILSPELLKILCEMGHSDRIVIADGNFPAESMGRDAHVIHMEGHGVPEILEAILSLFPLDTYVEHPVCLMSVTDGDTVETPIWDQYMTLVEACDSRGRSAIGHIERFAFYEEPGSQCGGSQNAGRDPSATECLGTGGCDARRV